MALSVLDPFSSAATSKWEPELRKKARTSLLLFLLSLATFLFFVGCDRVVRSSTYNCRCITETCILANRTVSQNETFTMSFSALQRDVGSQACGGKSWHCPIQSGKAGSDLCPFVVLETEWALLTVVYGVAAVVCAITYLAFLAIGHTNGKWLRTNPEANKLLKKRPAI